MSSRRFRLITALVCLVLLAGCAPNRLYTGPDESTVSVVGYVESVDGRSFERREGAHIVAPGVRMFKISPGWRASVYYALDVEPYSKYRIAWSTTRTLSGERISEGWSIKKLGSDEKPRYKRCAPRPLRACETDEKVHECVRRECLALGW